MLSWLAGMQEWRSDLPDMPVGRGGMGPAILLDGRFHIFSGEVRCDLHALHSQCKASTLHPDARMRVPILTYAFFLARRRCGSPGIVCPDTATGLTSTGVYTRIDRWVARRHRHPDT